MVEVEEDLGPREANRAVAEWKHHLREYFGEDLQRVNRARFALTGVLKEFNRGQNRWLARLEVQPCDISFLCEGGKRASYEVWILDRRTEDVVAKIYLDYDLERDVKRLLSVHETSDHYVLSFNDALDILNLAIKLMHAFSKT
jgi:hypothetical protein